MCDILMGAVTWVSDRPISWREGGGRDGGGVVGLLMSEEEEGLERDGLRALADAGVGDPSLPWRVCGRRTWLLGASGRLWMRFEKNPEKRFGLRAFCI